MNLSACLFERAFLYIFSFYVRSMVFEVSPGPSHSCTIVPVAFSVFLEQKETGVVYHTIRFQHSST